MDIKKYKKIIFFALICVLIVGLTAFKMLNKRDISEMTFEQARKKKQFHLDVRDGQGTFEIKPFKFSEVSYDDDIEVYFKNEGRNDVSVSFFRLTKDGPDNGAGEVVPAGESRCITFKNPTDNENDKFMVALSDPTEPMPVVIGEFYITDSKGNVTPT